MMEPDGPLDNLHHVLGNNLTAMTGLWREIMHENEGRSPDKDMLREIQNRSIENMKAISRYLVEG
jgi:hypothetical protein